MSPELVRAGAPAPAPGIAACGLHGVLRTVVVALRAGGGLCAALLVGALLAAAAPARAATYAVQTCTNGSVSGWSHFNYGDWSTWGNGCGVPGAGLSATIDPPAGSSAGWRFSAPADTDIAGFRVTRSYFLPANRPYGTGVYSLFTTGSGRDYANIDADFGGAVSAPPATEAASGLTGQTALTVRVDCGGGLSCTGRAGMTVFDAWLDLRDDSAPTITATSGSLLATGAQQGTRTLSYSATDRGGGLLREQLLVDGQPVADGPVDPGAAGCSGPPFGAVVPCPLSASATLRLDTTRLADGRHTLELAVWDATGVNRTAYGPFEIVVDNVPPPVVATPPRIVGAAEEGSTLTADDGTWSGSGIVLARRWQRLEDGAWQDLPGATGAAYPLTRDDVGHRLRLRVVATNADGSSEARSEPTAAVAAAPTPDPTPTPAAVPQAPRALEPAVSPPAPSDAVLTAAFETSGQRATTLRWGQARRIAGTLERRDGAPLPGASIRIASRARTAGAAPVALGSVTTDANGRFVYVLRPGVSRAIAFTHGAATATVTVRVIPHVVLHVGAGVLSGRVPGAPPGIRKLVELQTRRGARWRPFATTRLAVTGGTFRYRTRVPGRFRAVIRAEPGWPFLTGSSTVTPPARSACKPPRAAGAPTRPAGVGRCGRFNGRRDPASAASRRPVSRGRARPLGRGRGAGPAGSRRGRDRNGRAEG